MRQDFVHAHIAKDSSQGLIRLLRVAFFFDQGTLDRLFYELHEAAGAAAAAQAESAANPVATTIAVTSAVASSSTIPAAGSPKCFAGFGRVASGDRSAGMPTEFF